MFLLREYIDQSDWRRDGMKKKFIRIIQTIISLSSRDAAVGLSIAVIIVVVYSTSLSNAFISDDGGIVTNIQKTDVLFSTVRFLRSLVYYSTYLLFGLQPMMFRLGNILMHIGSVIVFYKIVSRMSTRTVGFMASLWFGIHPVLVESVAWISGGVYVQYGLLLFLSLYWYMLSKTNRTYFIFSIIAYVLALLTSDKAVVFAGIVFVYELIFGDIKTSWRHIAVYLAISGISIVFSFSLLAGRVSFLESVGGGSARTDNPVIFFTSAIALYAGLIFWPQNLSLYHSDPVITPAWLVGSSVITIIFLAVIVFCLRKNKQISFWLLFFLLSLAPVLSPFRITWIVAERYAYLATAAAMGAVMIFLDRVLRMPARNAVNIALWVIVFFSFSVLTMQRNMDWKSDDTFWLATVRASPEQPKAHNSLATVYVSHREYAKAIDELKTAIRLKPIYMPGYYNLGLVYEMINDKEQALQYYRKAKELAPNDKESAQAVERMSQ